MDQLERLQQVGVDVHGSLERFAGNQALYLRFISKFTSDPNYEKLSQSMEKRDYDQILLDAHTLKGVAANLGMVALSDWCAQIVAQLRSGDHSCLSQLFEQLSSCYQGIVAAIN